MQQNTKSNIEDIYELAPLQQGILFHTLYTEGSDAYIDQFCYDLSGDLNEEILKNAWTEIIKRHGVFRTSFQWKGISKPVQIVNKEAELPWKFNDWSNLSEEERNSDFKKFLEKDRSEVFSMEKAPLMRCTLIKLTESKYKFVWTFHHIIMDGWSYPIIQNEVFSIYDHLLNSKEIDLPKPVPYKQFILWLNKQDKESAGKFWKNELKGLDSPTIISSNYSDIQGKEGEAKEIDLHFSVKETSEIQLAAKKNQLTLNTVIQGVWADLLSTYSGEEEVLFGATVSGRDPSLRGVENMIGLFINTLPVRVKVDKSKDLILWLKEIQSNHLERDQYSYSSLIDIQEISGFPRGTQLFENILVFENYPPDRSAENIDRGIQISNLFAVERTNFPLTIVIAPGQSLSIKFIYDTSKYSPVLIEQIKTNFKTLLENFSKNSESKLSEISILTEAERNKIIYEWNETKVNYDLSKPVNRLIEEQTLRTPDSVAIEFINEKLTYKQLDEKANRVANYLIRSGIKPESIVGICIDRSLEMMIGLLGIMKAGGAYVPIDPSYPQERIDYMIEDSQAKIILTTSDLSNVTGKHDAKVIFLDKNSDELNNESTDTPAVSIQPDNMVYVIYTSGSTGNPKGVVNIHRGLSNQIQWIRDYLKCTAEDVVLQKTSFSFDVSTFELFMPLICGAKLVFAIPEGHKNNSYLIEVVTEKKITIIHFVTSMLSLFLEESYIDKCKSLRLFVSSGEEVTIPVQKLFFEKFPDVELHDLYGPTETSVHVTYWKCDSRTKLNTVPIGKPVANTQAYILDSYNNPVPVGIAGELHIGGAQVARGYFNREELTKERFIHDPFSEVKDSKLYKTGDLVRFFPDGNIEYLGRKDNQIKLRGFRIELGEIESVISEFKGIRNSVVIAKDFSIGDKRLIAYFVTENNADIPLSELKNFLSIRLPVFMIPSEFIKINEIPITGSGKVDKKALPEPETGRNTDSKNYSQPADSLELQLVKIWEKVIGKSPIGVKDNFFDLGGHSLIALRLFGYIEKLTGKKLPLSTLFKYQTIEQLAVILRDEGWKPQWKSLVGVNPGGSKYPFFYIPPAAGTALEVKNIIKYISDDQPFYILESVGLDGKEPPHTEIQQMSAHYVKEIQSLQPEGPYLIGGRCFGGRVAFDVAQRIVSQGQKVALLSIFDTYPPFTYKNADLHSPQHRDLDHFIKRTFDNLKSGDLLKVSKNYLKYSFKKFNKKAKDKLELIFSNERERLFKKIRQIHTDSQNRYIAKEFPGKITLIESAATKMEYREKWGKLAAGGIDYFTIPDTDHLTIVQEPKLQEFVEKLNYVLEKANNEINNNSVPVSQNKDNIVTKPAESISG
ncbi:MAG TPA: amino acid adenylation domain-containing protein [Ignavibacteria bacterium]|nr:amino acid adenylation domain-containing protein [Ignavibacteria bacterium]